MKRHVPFLNPMLLAKESGLMMKARRLSASKGKSSKGVRGQSLDDAQGRSFHNSKGRSLGDKSSFLSGADKKRTDVMRALLAVVAQTGWNAEALKNAFKKAGVSEGEGWMLFPQGLRDVAAFYGKWADAEMLKKVEANPNFARLRVREKVAFAVQARLEAMTPYREATRKLYFWYALPSHVLLGMQRLYQTVDAIWQLAGDTATDFNFYTKRGLLAAVLKATTLIWLDDHSPQCRESWAFLDRRLSEVLKLGKGLSLLKEWSPQELLDLALRNLRRAG